jgi:hypothetical protein
LPALPRPNADSAVLKITRQLTTSAHANAPHARARKKQTHLTVNRKSAPLANQLATMVNPTCAKTAQLPRRITRTAKAKVLQRTLPKTMNGWMRLTRRHLTMRICTLTSRHILATTTYYEFFFTMYNHITILTHVPYYVPEYYCFFTPQTPKYLRNTAHDKVIEGLVGVEHNLGPNTQNGESFYYQNVHCSKYMTEAILENAKYDWVIIAEPLWFTIG